MEVRWYQVEVRWVKVEVRWCQVEVRWVQVEVRWCKVEVKWVQGVSGGVLYNTSETLRVTRDKYASETITVSIIIEIKGHPLDGLPGP